MRPSSAAAVAVATATLREYLGDRARPGLLADQLFTASDALVENPKLVNALTDASKPLSQRRQLAARVFEDGADGLLQVIDTLLARSWAAPQDLPAVVEQLGVRALATAAAATGSAERLEQQLFALAETVAGNQQLRRVLADRSQSRSAARAQLLADVFADQVDANTLAIAQRAALRSGSLPFAVKLREYRQQIAAALGAKIATVRSADPLNEAQLERLGRALEGIYGSRMIINVATDPDLVGGMRVSVDSDVYDGTLKSALVEAQRALA